MGPWSLVVMGSWCTNSPPHDDPKKYTNRATQTVFFSGLLMRQPPNCQKQTSNHQTFQTQQIQSYASTTLPTSKGTNTHTLSQTSGSDTHISPHIEKKHSQLSPDIETSHPHLPQNFNRWNCVAHLKCPQHDTATTCCNTTTSPHTTCTPMPCHHIYNQHTIKKHRAQQNFPPILVMHLTTC